MITIAIPHYHRHEEDSKYLKQCFESIMAQTIYNECEILLCDDNSPRPDLMDNIIHQTGIRLMVVKHKENKGVGSARNTLIRIAKGDYIYFLDSDDMLYKVDELFPQLNLRYNEEGLIYFRIDEPPYGLGANIPEKDLPECVLLTVDEVKELILNSHNIEYKTAKLTLWKATK